ncbi:pilus assembly protein [Myxococcota bacterium]|nr:pilus assembly protein [Myxococcota bacterium]
MRRLIDRVRSKAARVVDDERGQAVVEFALTLPIFVILLLGVMYFGRSYYMDQSVRHAARYVAWKASRHGAGQTQAANMAREYFMLPEASISGSGASADLDDLELLTTDVFGGWGDPGGLSGEFSILDTFVNTVVSAGMAVVGTTYEVEIQESWQAPWFDFLGGTTVNRNHKVAYADWPKDEIYGDTVIMAFEAYLDIWAYDNITNM